VRPALKMTSTFRSEGRAPSSAVAHLVLVRRQDALPVKKLEIILLSVLAACTYGVIHDQITARLCIEYFTVAHPPLFHTGSTTLLALCWGVAATAGIGAALGVVLALVSQSDGPTPYPISQLGWSLLVLLAIMAASAILAGVTGYQLSHGGFISIPSGLSGILRAQQHDRFMAVWFAHGASYLVGLAGGALLCFNVWRARGKPSVISFFPHTRAAALRVGLLAAVAAYIIWLRLGAH
jgi:hypothetical protein